ncbi:hypothetical protein PROFUN_11704 [Planoprotostelium fungivorum]|uniref:Uncharacterized protein n=1 Tax=Planoprotostelium fungivorum TaxID=1890364 RepID=A0A2P6N957_9EUKA|nr:hypothetical protein PROFUN_11704 [Planoprotostelium fungivorum]
MKVMDQLGLDPKLWSQLALPTVGTGGTFSSQETSDFESSYSTITETSTIEQTEEDFDEDDETIPPGAIPRELLNGSLLSRNASSADASIPSLIAQPTL